MDSTGSREYIGTEATSRFLVPNLINARYDEQHSIGKRYSKHDEIGTLHDFVLEYGDASQRQQAGECFKAHITHCVRSIQLSAENQHKDECIRRYCQQSLRQSGKLPTPTDRSNKSVQCLCAGEKRQLDRCLDK